MTQLARDALTYFIRHEKEAMKELYGDGTNRRRMYAKKPRPEAIEESQ